VLFLGERLNDSSLKKFSKRRWLYSLLYQHSCYGRLARWAGRRRLGGRLEGEQAVAMLLKEIAMVVNTV